VVPWWFQPTLVGTCLAVPPGLDVAQRDHSPVIIAQSQPTVAMLLAFRDQEKILNELLADHSQPTEADRPRNFAPKPRSEISGTVII
jgi:hypothetical protein